jgi:hypothetical protein
VILALNNIFFEKGFRSSARVMDAGYTTNGATIPRPAADGG